MVAEVVDHYNCLPMALYHIIRNEISRFARYANKIILHTSQAYFTILQGLISLSDLLYGRPLIRMFLQFIILIVDAFDAPRNYFTRSFAVALYFKLHFVEKAHIISSAVFIVRRFNAEKR